MKTLSNPQDRAEILHRFQFIRPDSQRRWGKMSAHQMVCDVADAYRAYINEKRVSRAAFWYSRKLAGFVAIWVPLPWPHGFPTRPEVDQLIGGTPTGDFETDRQELEHLIQRVTRLPRDFEWQPHPVFGSLSERSWMRLGYRHADHHLRQFGA